MNNLFKLRCCFSLVLLSTLSFSQTLTVSYKTFFIDSGDYGGALVATNELVTNQEESIYYTLPIDTVISIPNHDFVQKIDSSNKSRGMKLYKNLKENYVVNSLMMGKLLKDVDYKIKWTVNESSKSILGYNCQEATGNFRGRVYHVYFTTELPYRNGPFKFDGLPGLILEVRSEDGCVNITALQVKNSAEDVSNPYKDSKKAIIDWNQYKKEYKVMFEKSISYRPETAEGVTTSSSIPKRDIEYLVDD